MPSSPLPAGPVDPLDRLARALQKLPGIGARTAQRLAFHLLKVPREEVTELAEALAALREQVTFCSVCCNLTGVDPCAICDDPTRDRTSICVVEDPANVTALEKTGRYRGLYHVLHGAISPMHGVGPDQIRVADLMKRLDGVMECILATNPTADGEATAVYLSRLLAPRGMTVSRIGMGLPVGAEIDYVDDATLARALDGRRRV